MSGVALSNGGAVQRSPVSELIDDGAAGSGGEVDPGCDLVERAEAAGAQPRPPVHHAEVDAGRGDSLLRVAHRAAAASGALALSARATRETGGRPRKSEMN